MGYLLLPLNHNTTTPYIISNSRESINVLLPSSCYCSFQGLYVNYRIAIDSCYQIVDSFLSLSSFNLTLLLLFLDGVMFLVVCYKSISHLTWPHQTPIFYYLLLNLLISITRLIATQTKITIIRTIYVCVLTVVMYIINSISQKLSEIAILLKPD